jgi:anti-sigma B factor antagonist
MTHPMNGPDPDSGRRLSRGATGDDLPGSVDLLDLVITQASTDAELAVRGEVDCYSAHELMTALDGVINAGHGMVALDLAGLDFIDAAGLRVVTRAASRLERSGRRLVVRSASPIVLRMLNVIEMSYLALPEPPPVNAR